MSILGSIMSKVFGHQAAAPASTPASASNASAPSATATQAIPLPENAAPAAASTAISQADVEGILANVASTYNHPVDWKNSIVDLLAMLGIDNSLAQRKTLAHELGYTGDTNDSATMNIWLHKQVMEKLEASGGKVPADLMH